MQELESELAKLKEQMNSLQFTKRPKLSGSLSPMLKKKRAEPLSPQKPLTKITCYKTSDFVEVQEELESESTEDERQSISNTKWVQLNLSSLKIRKKKI